MVDSGYLYQLTSLPSKSTAMIAQKLTPPLVAHVCTCTALVLYYEKS